MNDNHKRHLAANFRYVDWLLDEADTLFTGNFDR